MKVKVSDITYNEIQLALKRLGRDINDGTVISLEKGDAIIPPRDFRMVAIRQNCLMAASEIYKTTPSADADKGEHFLNIAQEIFDWCLNGKDDTEQSKIEKKEWK